MPEETLLKANSITKSFAGVRALKGISFHLAKGEVHALVGENGAGKSTFTKIVMGAMAADSGQLEISGQIIRDNNPNYARSLGISAIYQQPSLFPHLSVSENISLPLERVSRRWVVDWKARHSRSQELIERLGGKIDIRRPAGSLSMAEQQLVEIAKAIGLNAKILLMDEPTSLLTDREVEHLFGIVRQLRDEGVGIVYISHRLEEVQAIADRITVFRDGETVACKDAKRIERGELIQLMVGRSLTSIFPKREVPIGETALEVRGFRNDAVGLHGISLSVREGEILGVAGLVGSGRTEFARTLFGLTPSDSKIILRGVPVHVDSPECAINLGIGYLPEDRRQHGVVLEMNVASNVSMASLKSVSRWGLIDREKEACLGSHYIHNLKIKTPGVSAEVGTLSGGNQQKVAFARWLAIKPRIMVLDEPTQGVDVGSKAEIHDLIVRLAESGVAVILISSELREILGMCDRIAVFHQKTIAGILSREEATQSRIMALALGHSDAASQETVQA
jgi:ABC-type sugar transport system ATPase subunit